MKVVEKVSNTIKKSLTKSNPFKEVGCHQISCKVCETGGKVDCKARDVVYRISCKGMKDNGDQCESIEYVGETSRSIAERFNEHVSVLNSHQETTKKRSFLYNHVLEEHKGRVPLLDLQIVNCCFADASLRQAMEAVLIRDEDPILDRKEEYNNEPRKRKSRVKNVTSDPVLTSNG